MQPTEQLLAAATAYCGAKGMSKARLATILFNDGKKFGLIEGGGDLGTKTHARAMQWLSDNWPENAEWPNNATRPARNGVAA